MTEPKRVNGWSLFYFYIFAEIVNDLEKKVSKLKNKASDEEFKQHPKTKLLANIYNAIKNIVPSNPTDKMFLLGNTLGTEYRSFRRVKKNIPPRYRLFFRFSSTRSVIIYIWLNDEKTLRKEGDKNDVYETFKRMLKSGKVPQSLEELLKMSSSPNLSF